MKAFWALMALLTIAAVVMFTTDLGGTTTPPVAADKVAADRVAAKSNPAPAPVPPAAVIKAPTPPPSEPESATRPAEVMAPIPVPAPSETPSPKQAEPEAPALAAAPSTTPELPPSTTPDPATPETTTPPAAIKLPTAASTEDENLLIKLREEIEAERAKREAAAKPELEAPTTLAPTAEATAPAGNGLFGEAAAESKPDGSILVEGKFIVKGQGTQADPYKITWDQLISAERDYAPKDGKKSIPARIQALNDKWVEITGYVTFPLMADETDELLAMMNQWDGCCIGIPPTPYDAIEVRLASTVSGDGRLTTYGVIKGKFKVDPHLVGGWLVGLYVIDQGKLTPVAYGGVAP